MATLSLHAPLSRWPRPLTSKGAKAADAGAGLSRLSAARLSLRAVPVRPVFPRHLIPSATWQSDQKPSKIALGLGWLIDFGIVLVSRGEGLALGEFHDLDLLRQERQGLFFRARRHSVHGSDPDPLLKLRT